MSFTWNKYIFGTLGTGNFYLRVIEKMITNNKYYYKKLEKGVPSVPNEYEIRIIRILTTHTQSKEFII